MQKQTIAQKSVYWLKVISLGLILGLGIQFAQAWAPPGSTPPGGNVSGPITTSGVAQYKTGKLGVNSSGAPVDAFEVGGGGNARVTGNITAAVDIAAVRNSYAGNAFAAPWICIGSDCRNAWPTGGGGGSTTITGGSCGTGTVMNSISASGVPGCIADAVGGGGTADNLGNHKATIDLDMSSKKITNLAAPTVGTDGVNKSYVDGKIVVDNTRITAGTSNWITLSAYDGANANTNWYGCENISGFSSTDVMTSCSVAIYPGGNLICGYNISGNKCQSNGCMGVSGQLYKMKVTCIKSI